MALNEHGLIENDKSQLEKLSDDKLRGILNNYRQSLVNRDNAKAILNNRRLSRIEKDIQDIKKFIGYVDKD